MDAAYLDFAKAFNSVPHQRLLFAEDFLFARNQRVA